MNERNYWTTVAKARFGRRRMLMGALAAGTGVAGAALIGCGGGESKPATQATQGAGAAPAGGTTAAAPKERPGIPVVKGAPKPGGTFTTAITATNAQHDMHTALAGTVWHTIGERALELDEWSGDLRGNVAESWEVADPTHLVLKVRAGVKLHNRPPWNGRDFNSEDLAFNINRIAGLTADQEKIPLTAFQRASTLAGMDRAEAVDPRTVRVTMKQPTSTFFRGLTEIRNQLMPKDVVELGFSDPLKFAGFGPFQITEFQSGVKEVYTKFDGYYRKGEPYFDKVVRQVLPDLGAILAAFLSKQVSYFGGPTPTDVKTIKAARPDATFYEYTGTNWFHIRPNNKYGAFTDFRVRKALQLAPNYQEIGDGYYGPGWTYSMAFHPNYPEAYPQEKVKSLPGYNPTTKDKDRAEAAKLLSAAGHGDGDGVQFEILCQTADVYKENALRYQDQLTKLFSKSKITVKTAADAATFAKLQSDRNFQAISYTITTLPDVVLEGISQYHSKGSRNYGSFENAEADAILDKALAELDTKARTQLMQNFQDKFFNEWQPLVQLYIDPERYFFDGSIGGFDTSAGPWGFTGYRIANKAGRWYFVK